MPTRRQAKVARAVKEVVSDAIAHHLNDPRIEGFVSVTRVEVSADLRGADVYVSIFGGSPSCGKRTFSAIQHARSRIQSVLAGELECKFCPVLRFHMDDKFKESLETIRLIEETGRERAKREAAGETEEVS
jgi:ribosome-binding factor A